MRYCLLNQRSNLNTVPGRFCIFPPNLKCLHEHTGYHAPKNVRQENKWIISWTMEYRWYCWTSLCHTPIDTGCIDEGPFIDNRRINNRYDDRHLQIFDHQRSRVDWQ